MRSREVLLERNIMQYCLNSIIKILKFTKSSHCSYSSSTALDYWCVVWSKKISLYSCWSTTTLNFADFIFFSNFDILNVLFIAQFVTLINIHWIILFIYDKLIAQNLRQLNVCISHRVFNVFLYVHHISTS